MQHHAFAQVEDHHDELVMKVTVDPLIPYSAFPGGQMEQATPQCVKQGDQCQDEAQGGRGTIAFPVRSQLNWTPSQQRTLRVHFLYSA